ncbi:hypothetical protein T4A_7697 [Trichinella pseudospiralis]|uniref:Uncharacterized protein n=1 Tax=Trichinella pseudospiralis TaxID=6337 RepID=A0A0V1DQZ7_TRIPS|nr:hypothetical protein T4A_7697 [Trichinella pseudospiralis]
MESTVVEREAEIKGKAPANTCPSPNDEGRANSLAEETDEPARGSGSLQYNAKCKRFKDNSK